MLTRVIAVSLLVGGLLSLTGCNTIQDIAESALAVKRLL